MRVHCLSQSYLGGDIAEHHHGDVANGLLGLGRIRRGRRGNRSGEIVLEMVQRAQDARPRQVVELVELREVVAEGRRRYEKPRARGRRPQRALPHTCVPECVGLVSDQQIKALAGAEVAAMPLQALIGDERHRVPRRARRDEEMKSVHHCQIGRRPLEHGHVERVRRAAKPLAKLLRSGKTDRDRQKGQADRKR